VSTSASTPFREILKQATNGIPGAVGGALAAGDGELLDAWTEWDSDDWAFLTAHVGIVVNHVRCAMHTFHFGDVEWVSMHYSGLDLVIEQLGDKYFVLLACKPPMNLGMTTDLLRSVAQSLREEMF
tara:strand:+ start:107805 stop:108182 length:378 start_codon:yes stop_codon:yes gene_type:complete